MLNFFARLAGDLELQHPTTRPRVTRHGCLTAVGGGRSGSSGGTGSSQGGNRYSVATPILLVPATLQGTDTDLE